MVLAALLVGVMAQAAAVAVLVEVLVVPRRGSQALVVLEELMAAVLDPELVAAWAAAEAD
jgi:hypothetical protein